MGCVITKENVIMGDNKCCICLEPVPDTLQSRRDYNKFIRHNCCNCILHKECSRQLNESNIKLNNENKCPTCRGNPITGEEEHVKILPNIELNNSEHIVEIVTRDDINNGRNGVFITNFYLLN